MTASSFTSSLPSHDLQIIQELSATMGIAILGPQSPSEKLLAQNFGEFANFVLNTAKDECREILEMELNRKEGCGGNFLASSVGILQGGNDLHSIYRVSFPASQDEIQRCCDDNDYQRSRIKHNRKHHHSQDDNIAAMQLLHLYNQQCINKSSMLTIDDIQQYMLDMLDHRDEEKCKFGRSQANHRRYRLGNLMFILQFGGPTSGQVRHIDNMVPNVQICLYMSHRCPSTIVYVVDDLGGLSVSDGESLIHFWERQHQPHDQQHPSVPTLIRQILLDYGDTKLRDVWYTQYFTRWNTINSQLECFGKLYQPVSRTLSLDAVSPGTTLIAGGNDIHAGPPTMESRMFAFAIGISEPNVNDEEGIECHYDDDDDDDDDDDATVEVMEKVMNDGEVQYSPVLLHMDLCCLLFSILDYTAYDASVTKDMIREGKVFLVCILLRLIREHPTDQYLLQIDAGRAGVRTWLEKVLALLRFHNENENLINDLIQEAVSSDTILYSPDVIKRKSRKKNCRHKKMKGSVCK